MKKNILLILGLIATLGLGVQNALACSCMPATGSEYYDMADKVFAGEVTHIKTSDGSVFNPFTTVGDKNLEVTLTVEEDFKNSSSETLKVVTADNSAACGITFEEGEKYLVFTSKNDRGESRATLCNGTRNLEQSGDLIKDFSKKETYDSYDVFMEVEGKTCSTYSDGCNTIGLENGIPTTTTMAYCEDHTPTYSCISKKDTSEEDPIMCTQQYEPVCGVDGKTYGNSCMAHNVEIAYEGECREDIKNIFKTKAHETKYKGALDTQEKQLEYLTPETQTYLLNNLIQKTRKYMEKLTTDQAFISKFEDSEYKFRLLEYIEMRLVKMQDNLQGDVKIKGRVKYCDDADVNMQCEVY